MGLGVQVILRCSLECMRWASGLEDWGMIVDIE